VQPLIALAGLLLLAGVVATFALRARRRSRNRDLAAIAAAAVVCLVIGETLPRSAAIDRTPRDEPGDEEHRGQGIARAALVGTLDQIAHAGGGLVEAISDVHRPRGARRFLLSATVELFEQFGFTCGRQVGKHAWIVSRVIDPL
jgi:hypothetical protein